MNFAELSTPMKAAFGAILGFAILMTVLFFMKSGGSSSSGGGSVSDVAGPGQVILFKNMEPKDTGEVATVLERNKIGFHIIQDGTAIAVSASDADEARVKLSQNPGNPLPKDGAVGYSQLFGDKPNSFLSTDFEKKVAFNRALNGELSKLIKKVEGIEAASVLINTPEEQLFTEERKPTTASVMVKVAANKSLTKQQIEGVQHLVASAVPGLKSNNVEVVAETGKLLSDGFADNAGDQEDRRAARELDRQMMLTHEREQAIETKVQSLLDKIFGAGKSVVRVAAELDFTQKKTKTTLYAPPVDANRNNIPTSKQTITEKSTNGAGGGGVIGSTANIPGKPTYGIITNPANGNQVSERRQETINNGQLSMNQTLTEDEVGMLKRLSVTALIQGLPNERIPAMTQIVSATAGADQAGRGDVVVVQPVAFDTSQTDMLKQLLEQQEQQKTAAAKGKKEGGLSLNFILMVGGAILALIIIVALIRLASRKEDTTEVLVNSLGDPGLPQGFDPNALGGYPGMEMQGTVPMAGGDEGPFGFLEQMDPEMVADLLSQERPGTAAGILGLLNPGYADMVLQIMPPEMQEDLINRLQTQPQLPAFQQKTVAQQLKRRLGVPA
ncbi:MAG: flagellar M-ring protein FliF [Cyanobacteria bacterium RYN_339]|nr:flagellar M-ring protein FliF [Cyanobacteria bacterium RYN_339]